MKNSMILKALGMCLLTTMASPTASAGEAGDAQKGADVFKAKCGFCHATEAGAQGMGSSMAGIYGKKAGSTKNVHYVGLKGADFVWDDESLDGFLENPKEFLGRTSSMPTKTASADDRANLIAYLKTLK